MEKNYKSLLSTILAWKLDWFRMNDISVSPELYSIGFYDYKDALGKTTTRLCLRDSKNKEYNLSEYQLAALRCAIGPVTAEWLDQFKEDVNGTTFQKIAADIDDLESVKLKAVSTIKIRNHQVKDLNTPIYKDTCYEGSKAYAHDVRDFLKDKAKDFALTAEYRNKMRDLRDVLYATKLEAGKDVDANIVRLPIFNVVG
jgi:hypothetical protein